MLFGRSQHGAAFVHGEGVVVAEGVAIAGEFELRRFWNQLVADKANVFLAAVRKFRRDSVRGQQRGNDARRTFLVEPADDAEHAQFRVVIETVTGLGFYRCGSAAQHPVAMAACGGKQLVIRGAARKAHGAKDASAGSGDLLVGGAGDTLLEFIGAVAGEDQMRVRIDETRRNTAASRVDYGCVGGNAGAHLGLGSNCGNIAVLDEQRCVLDDGEIAQFCACARACETANGDKLANVDDGDHESQR